MKFKSVFVFVVLVLFTFIGVVQGANIEKGPYLIYEGNNTTMTVLWQLDGTDTCTLAWGTTTSYSTGSVQTNQYGSDNQHKYTIPNLNTATKYYYRVTFGSSSYNGSFRSAPAGSAQNVKFFAYGDTRTYPSDHNAVANRMINTYTGDPAYQTLTLHVADFVDDGESESDWTNEFFPRSYSNIIEMQANLPIMGCIGNHEGNGGLLRKYFPYPYQTGSDFYYSYDYGPIHVAVIDQYTSYSSGSTQYNWLANDLASTSKKWIFILLHEPGWSAGGHSNEVPVQDYIQPLCTQYGVDIVFGGHNHYYARCVVDDIQHVTTGGGGAPLYSPSSSAQYLVESAETLHHCEINIQGTQLNFVARDSNGSVLDSFVLNDTSVPLPPVAQFTASAVNITEGQSVTFTDTSTNSPTSWSWTFEGGSPANSTSQNQTVTYNNAGTYDVTLTATNSEGSDPETKTNYITVTEVLPIVGHTTVFSLNTTTANRRTMPFTMPEDGTISSVTMYHTGGSGSMILGVYDGEGAPADRLGVTPTTAVNGSTGWQTINLTSSAFVSGGSTVWLAWVYESNPGIWYEAGTPGRRDAGVAWSGGMPDPFGSSTEADFIYSIYAGYAPGGGPVQYTLTTNTVGQGSIALNPTGGTYNDGTVVTLTANPSSGWEFSGWSGALSGSTNPTTITMDSDKTVTATFTEVTVPTYTLTTNTVGQGSIALNPAGGTYTEGTVVTVTANPSSGWQFDSWSGALSGSTNPTTINMNANKSVTATFTETGTTQTVGSTVTYGSSTTTANRRSMPFTMPEDGTISSVTMYHTGGSGSMILGVYEGEGSPTNRLGVTATTAVSAGTGWQTINLQSSAFVASGTTVWLAWVYESNPGISYESGTPGRVDAGVAWSGGMPDPFGSSTQANYIYSIYATYTPGGGTVVTPVANFTGSPTTVDEGQSVSFTDTSSNNPTSWSWSFPGGTPSSSTVRNPTVTYNTAGTYSVTLTAANSAGSDPETKSNYITVEVPTITYCTLSATNQSYEWIAGVQVGSIDNASGASGYSDFTAQSANLTKGASVSITLTPGFASDSYSEFWKIWIDLNGDGDFEDSGEEVYSGSGTSAIADSFTVPASATSGNTRMRIAMQYNAYASYCGSFTDGEVEDYTVNIQ